MIRILLICLLTLSMNACAVFHKSRVSTPPPPHPRTLIEEANLQQGERFFRSGYYKKAMHVLLPLACDGVADAQYAVGYMYYYGLGVTQDSDVGYIWIRRAADQHFQPAIDALHLIETCQNNGDKIPQVTRPRMTQ